MSRYRVYATRWDDPHVVEEIPARGLEFSMPVNEHGEASFSATVEPGRSFWRSAVTALASGVLVARDGVPVWSGLVWSERQTGPRTFDFQCAEWGSFFERVPAAAHVFGNDNDHLIFRTLVDLAQLVTGQDVKVLTGSTLGAATSDLTINAWDDLTVERAFRSLGDAADGPEWYFGTGGTLENPTRPLVLGGRLGLTDAATVLEYVEDTAAYVPPAGPPVVTVLGNVFPGLEPQAVLGRRGGNVIAHPARVRDGSVAATATIAIGSGEEAAQLRRYATSTLLDKGFPRVTKSTAYTDVTVASTLQRHANADLAAAQGLITGYTLTTFDGEPDWTDIPRGSTVRVSLDTDVYGMDRPFEFDTRVLDIAVQVQDDGPALVNFSTQQTLET